MRYLLAARVPGLVGELDGQVTRLVSDEERPTHGARRHALHGRTPVCYRLHHSQVVEVAHVVVVLGIGDGRAQHLLDEAGRRLRREL
jgi:hypothetical protein